MNKKILKKILKTSSIEFSTEEIRNMLDEELEKSPEEMDTELIDLCIEALTSEEPDSGANDSVEEVLNEDSSEKSKNRKKKNIRKVFLIAAVISILAVISVSVSANVFEVDAKEGNVIICDDYIKLRFTEQIVNSSEEISDNCNIADFVKVNLPSAFSDKNCILTEHEEIREKYHSFSFRFSDNESTCDVELAIYPKGAEEMKREIMVFCNTECIKHQIIDGIEMFIFAASDSRVFVIYKVGRYGYDISFENTSFDEVCKLFQSF